MTRPAPRGSGRKHKHVPALRPATASTTPGEFVGGLSPSLGKGLLVLSPTAVAQLLALIAAVRDEVGECEFCALLLGELGSRVVQAIHLVRNQRVSSVSFDVDGRDLSDSVAEALRKHPGLVVLGIAHEHPGTGPSSVFHSRTDDEWISDKVSSLLATGALQSRQWTRRVAGELRDGEVCFQLDDGGRQRLRVPVGRGGFAGSPTEPCGAAIDVTETYGDFYSLVFSRALDFFCLGFTHTFLSLATESGATETHHRMASREVKVVVQRGDDVAVPDAERLRERVREHVHTWSYGSGWWSRSGTNTTTSSPIALAPTTGSPSSPEPPATDGDSPVLKPALYWAAMSTQQREPTTLELLADTVVSLRELCRHAARSGGKPADRLHQMLKLATDELEFLIDERWTEVQ